MKKKAIRVGVLGAVFIIAVIFFSYLTNKDNTDMSADMGSATLPRISFTTEGYEVNELPGYVTDMELTSMRDTVTPVNDNKLTMNLKMYDGKIEKLTWQVFTLDGEECLQKETVSKVEETYELRFNENGMLDKERALKITLHLPEKDVYYYTRIRNAEECNYNTCLDFAKTFHENAMNKEDTEKLNAYLETVSGGDSAGFQKVTLHSSLDYVTWGELKPEQIQESQWEIKECNEAYTSLVLVYRVKVPGAEACPEATYSVEEFFRIRVVNDKTYLMDYERVMEQAFDGTENALDTKGVLLGVASEDVEYKHNSDGTIVAFVQNHELWNYDKEHDEVSLLFSFADSENQDIRNYYQRHEIHIDSVDEDGNTLFYVSGYMNRGDHEGKVGVAVYYFNNAENSITERVFVPSKKGYEIMREDLGKFVHYSEAESKLYVMVDGCLYCVDTKEEGKEILVRGLEENQYVTCEEAPLLAYENGEKLVLLNMDTGESFEILTENGNELQPVGFIHTDFVYGEMRPGDEGYTLTGEKVLPMYKIEIINQKQEIGKTYELEGIWIQDVTIEGNVMTLNRVVKSGENYTATATDYITSNKAMEESNIALSSYTDENRSIVRRLTYEDGIRDKDPKVMKPKQVLQEAKTTVRFDEAKMEGKYYVYALGHLQKVFDKAGEAIQYANSIQGVVISSRQAYVWERGNWPNAYEVDDMEAFSASEGESTISACLNKMLAKEGVEMNLTQEMKEGMSPEEILSTYSGGEGLNLTGCTIEELQYTISQETPVLAMIGDGKAVLLIGYNKTNIAYLDPSSGTRISVAKETMEYMASQYGNIFVGYVK